MFELLAQAEDVKTWAGLSGSVGASKTRGEGSHEEEDHPPVSPDSLVEGSGAPRFHLDPRHFPGGGATGERTHGDQGQLKTRRLWQGSLKGEWLKITIESVRWG